MSKEQSLRTCLSYGESAPSRTFLCSLFEGAQEGGGRGKGVDNERITESPHFRFECESASNRALLRSLFKGAQEGAGDSRYDPC